MHKRWFHFIFFEYETFCRTYCPTFDNLDKEGCECYTSDVLQPLKVLRVALYVRVELHAGMYFYQQILHEIRLVCLLMIWPY